MKSITKTLKLSQIKTDSGTQVRAAINREAVSDYAEAMKESAKFPPVVVYKVGTDYLLVDGFHRIEAAKANDFLDFPAEIFEGTRGDAIGFALLANTAHGLRRTNADKVRSIEIALREFPEISSSEIANLCAVHRSTVDDLRKKIQPAVSAGSRIGKDGKRRSAVPPPRAKPASVAAPATPTPPASGPPPPKAAQTKPQRPVDATGFYIPDDVLPIWERRQEIQDLLSKVSEVRTKLRREETSGDILYALIHFNSANAHLEQAYSDISTAKLTTVCPVCGGDALLKNCTLCKGLGLLSDFRWKSVTSELKDMRKIAVEKQKP